MKGIPEDRVRFFARYLEGDVMEPGWEEWGRETIPSLPNDPIVLVEWKGEGDPRVSEGKKDDHGKVRWSTLPASSLIDVAAVTTAGGDHYGDDNWQRVPNAKERYFNAAMRHLMAWQSGEEIDPSSGKPHLSHATANMLFLRWFETNKKGE